MKWLLSSLIVLLALASSPVPAASSMELQSANETRKVVFVAGPRSHANGDHEHRAGCMLLAKRLGCLLVCEENVTGDSLEQRAVARHIAALQIVVDAVANLQSKRMCVRAEQQSSFCICERCLAGCDMMRTFSAYQTELDNA